MFKLMKYELYRRKTLLLSVLLTMVAVEAIICFGIYQGGGLWGTLSVVLTFVLLFGGLLFPFADTVINYYSDFKNKHGYMLFLTPNKGIKIIGSKALFALIELIITATILGGSLVLTFTIFKELRPEIYEAVFGSMFRDLGVIFGVENATFWTILPLLLTVVWQYFNSIMIAVMSVTISKTVLSKNNFNWILALLMYFAISFGVQTLNTSVLLGFGFANDMVKFIKADTLEQVLKYVYVGAGIYTFWIAISTAVSSILLNKRTDL